MLSCKGLVENAMECENTSVKLSGQIFASMLSATTNHVSSVDLNRLGLHQLSPVLDQSHWVVAHVNFVHTTTQLSFSF